MKRSIYYDGVELFAEHLNYTEETKIDAIRKIVTTMGVCGPVKGLIIKRDGNELDKVVVTAGEGYTYGGDWYEIVFDVGGIVVDTNRGVENYVVVKVEEVEEYPVEDVISGEVRNTRISERYVIDVLVRSEWEGVSDKSKYSLLGVVVGNGGAISEDDIYNVNKLDVKCLFVKRQVGISGIKVRAVSSMCVEGRAWIKYVYEGGVKKIAFKGRSVIGGDDGDYGKEVVIGADGVYRLWNLSERCFVDVEVESQWLLNESLEGWVEIVDLLIGGEMGMGTVKDRVHRNMVGRGLVSPSNPHGQTLDDLDPGVNQDLIKHRRVEHSAGIIGVPGSGSLRASVYGGNRSLIVVNGLVGSDYVVSGGKIIDRMMESYVSVRDYRGEVYVYLNEEGGLGVAESNKLGKLISENYFLVCKVSVDNNGNAESIEDLRRWGSMSDRKVFYSGGELLDANVFRNEEFTVNDSVRMIKWVLQNLIGSGDWRLLPTKSVVELINVVQDLTDRLNLHVNLSYRTGAWIHGVRLGHDGHIDADMLDGVHRGTGHTGDSSGIDADMLDGFHAGYILSRGTGKVVFCEGGVGQLEPGGRYILDFRDWGHVHWDIKFNVDKPIMWFTNEYYYGSDGDVREIEGFLHVLFYGSGGLNIEGFSIEYIILEDGSKWNGNNFSVTKEYTFYAGFLGFGWYDYYGYSYSYSVMEMNRYAGYIDYGYGYGKVDFSGKVYGNAPTGGEYGIFNVSSGKWEAFYMRTSSDIHLNVKLVKGVVSSGDGVIRIKRVNRMWEGDSWCNPIQGGYKCWRLPHIVSEDVSIQNIDFFAYRID